VIITAIIDARIIKYWSAVVQKNGQLMGKNHRLALLFWV
jgi:hypothetical protein